MFGGQSALAKALGGEPPTHILGDTFYSQLPIRYSDFIAKVQLAPVSPDLTDLTGKAIDIGRPDILKELVVDHFRMNTSVWEIRVQLCADLETTPIDDPTKRWDETKSAFIAVARLTVDPSRRGATRDRSRRRWDVVQSVAWDR